jgi:hypothetical protein
VTAGDGCGAGLGDPESSRHTRGSACTLHELVGETGCIDGETIDWIAAYEEGLKAYIEKRFDAAATALARAREHRPHDRATELLMEQVAACSTDGVPDGWTGTIVMAEK